MFPSSAEDCFLPKDSQAQIHSHWAKGHPPPSFLPCPKAVGISQKAGVSPRRLCVVAGKSGGISLRGLGVVWPAGASVAGGCYG